MYVRRYKNVTYYALVLPFFKVYFTSEKDISCKGLFSYIEYVYLI